MKQLIDNFINGVSIKRMHMETSVTRVKDKLRHIKYTLDFHAKILKLDLFTYNNHMGFSDAEFYRELTSDIDYPQLLAYRFSIPYMSEKLIVTLNNKSKRAKNPRNSIIDFLKDAYLGSGSIKSSSDRGILEKLFFNFGYDQIKLQKKSRIAQSFVRILELYKPYPEVDDYLIDTIGLNLEKICILIWILFSYIIKPKKVFIHFSIEDFKKYAVLSESIENEDIDKFLDFMLVDLKTFKDEYFRVRTNLETKELYSDKKLEEIDQFLPKISFWYPLLLVPNRKEMFLVSYTALVQSMELERLYDLIYNCNIENFKGNTHGPAFENYVKNFIKKRVSAKVYGNERYKVSKKIIYDEPDAIVEFDDYVVFIECKSKPFNILEALQEFNDYKFIKIENDYKTSNENIDRYLKYGKDFKEKHIYRIMVYLSSDSVSLSSVVPKPVSSEMLITTDIRSLEMLFSLDGVEIDKVLDEYCSLVKKNSISSLDSLIEPSYYKNVNDELSNTKFKDIFNTHLKR